jgi:hypothetical protein
VDKPLNPDSAGSPGRGSVSSDNTIQTDVAAHWEFASWLVGSRGALGGVGGFSEAFEQDVVEFVEKLQDVARGTNTKIEEANWFRRASMAQTAAMARFATGTRLGLSALGNAAGSTGDAYDKADRASQRSFDPALDILSEPVFGRVADLGL